MGTVLLSSDEDWEAVLKDSEDRLIFLDCHQDWCGPCAALDPVISRFFMDTAECESRIAIYTSIVDDIKERIQEMKHVEGAVDLGSNGCTPYFIFLRNGKSVRAFSGVCGPDIIEFMQNNLPPIKKHDEDAQ